MRFVLLILVMLLMIFACTEKVNKEIISDQEHYPPFVKSKLLLNEGEFTNMKKPIIYKDKLILFLSAKNQEEANIKCLNKETFKLLWTWDVELKDSELKSFGSSNYVYDDILAISNKNYSAGINVNTGQTIWEKNSDSQISCMIGNEGLIASFAAKIFNDDASIKIADIESGNWKTIYEVSKTDSLNIQLRSPYPFSWDNKQYVCFVQTKWYAKPSIRQNWLHLYNVTEDKLEWVSDTIPLFHPQSGTPGAQPIFEDGQILLANDAIYSYNIEDGSLEWWKRYPNRFVFTTHLKSNDGIVYGNNETKHFIGLDVHTGKELIKTDTGGSASSIEYYNGKCFMTDVTQNDGLSHLMVINSKTGSVIHDITAPFYHHNRNWCFSHSNVIDPQTGLYYASDHKYLLVYDFNQELM